MVPVFIPMHKAYGPLTGPARKGGGDRTGGYAGLILAISGLLAVLGVVMLIAWVKPQSRRAPSSFMETLAIEPIVAGALASLGAEPSYDVSGAQGTTLWWKRRYEERSFLITASLAGPQVAPFLNAVRDSLEQRVIGAGATRRGLQSIGWPDSGSTAEPAGPALVSMPYAFRKRVGWISIQAASVRDGRLAMGVTVHEGPKPTD